MTKEYPLSLKKTMTTKLELCNKLSNNWVYHFINRLPQLVVKPNKLSLHRAKSISQTKIKRFLKNFPSLWSQTIFQTNPIGFSIQIKQEKHQIETPSKIVCNKDINNAQVMASERSSAITIIAVGNAVAIHTIPFLPGQR